MQESRDKFRLDGKVALITGASKGIGAAIARGLAQAGAAVMVSSRKQEAVDAVAASLREEGLQAAALAAHMGHAGDIERLAAATSERFGGVDILVNNAATNPVFGPLQHSDAKAFDKIMEVNLKGPFLLARAVYPSMKARGGGSIINISSIGGIKPEPGIGLYSVSKAALISLTQVMARDWGPDGIRANAICPGLIRTKFSAALWQNDAILQRFLQQIPLGRVGEPDDLVGLALFLASPASAYCTGGVYLADGGYLVA